jgi:hypothetical protein
LTGGTFSLSNIGAVSVVEYLWWCTDQPGSWSRVLLFQLMQLDLSIRNFCGLTDYICNDERQWRQIGNIRFVVFTRVSSFRWISCSWHECRSETVVDPAITT